MARNNPCPARRNRRGHLPYSNARHSTAMLLLTPAQPFLPWPRKPPEDCNHVPELADASWIQLNLLPALALPTPRIDNPLYSNSTPSYPTALPSSVFCLHFTLSSLLTVPTPVSPTQILQSGLSRKIPAFSFYSLNYTRRPFQSRLPPLVSPNSSLQCLVGVALTTNYVLLYPLAHSTVFRFLVFRRFHMSARSFYAPLYNGFIRPLP